MNATTYLYKKIKFKSNQRIQSLKKMHLVGYSVYMYDSYTQDVI